MKWHVPDSTSMLLTSFYSLCHMSSNQQMANLTQTQPIVLTATCLQSSDTQHTPFP